MIKEDDYYIIAESHNEEKAKKQVTGWINEHPKTAPRLNDSSIIKDIYIQLK